MYFVNFYYLKIVKQMKDIQFCCPYFMNTNHFLPLLH